MALRSVHLLRSLTVILLALVAFSGPVGAQSTPTASPPTPAITTEDGKVAFTFVQASSSLGAVDVLLDDEVVLPNVTFGQVSEFLAVDDGDHTVKLVPAGGDISQAVVEQDLSMDGSKIYEVVAAGPIDKIEVKTFEMLVDPTVADDIRLRVIHAASSLDAIDIAPEKGMPIVENVEYFNASDHVDYRAGDITLEVRATGEQGRLVVLPTFTATAGSVIDLIVTEDAMGAPVALYVGVSAGTVDDADAVATPAT